MRFGRRLHGRVARHWLVIAWAVSLWTGSAAALGSVVATLGEVGAADADLYVLDETGAPRLLVDTPGRVTRAAWDPSGSRLLITDILPDRSADHRVVTFDADGRVVDNERIALVPAPPTRMATSAIYTWHPSGDSVLYKGEDRACTGNVVYRRFLDGSEHVYLDPAVVGDGVVYSIDFHPNGREVLWTSQVGCWSPTLKLFTAPLVDGAIDVRNVRLLLDDGQYVAPAVYSPDGTMIALRRSDARARYDGPENVYVMHADGTGMRPLTSNERAADRVLGHLVWSPDGRELRFSQSRDWLGVRTAQVYRAHVDGSGVEPVTATTGQALVVAPGAAHAAGTPTEPTGGAASSRPLGADRLDHAYRVDWGRFRELHPTVRGFAGVTSETGITATFADAGSDGAWFVDVVVTGTPASDAHATDDVRLVSVFPVGVVSVALPEPDAWVDYGGITVSLYEPAGERWIAVRDSSSRPGAESMLGAWIDAAFVAVDLVSLAVPKAQLLKLALLLPEVAIERDEARWLTAFDASTVVPEHEAFHDPNVHRLVQVPWRFDGLEGFAATERVWGDERSARWPCGRALLDDGLVPVRVRIPVLGLSETAMRDVLVSVALTEEHSIVAQLGARNPLSGTTASPIARPPRFLSLPDGWTSVSAYALRTVTTAVRRLDGADEGVDDGWVARLEAARQRPLRPDFAGAAGFSFDGSTADTTVPRVRYDSSVSMALEPAGTDTWAFVLGIEATVPTHVDGRPFTDGRRGYTLDHRDGVAYLALPNVVGLEIDYDAVAMEAFDHEGGEWVAVPNLYSGPTRRGAWDRVAHTAWDMVLGEAFEAIAGQGIARTVTVVGIVADVAGLAGLLEPSSEPGMMLPLPVDSAFYDPNRFRVVQVPWQVGVMDPGWHSVREDMLRFVSPYDHERGTLRLRLRIPVSGLTPAQVEEARGFIAAVERVLRWDAVGWSGALGRAIIEPSLARRRLVSGVSLAATVPDRDVAPPGGSRPYEHVARFVDPTGAWSFFARGAALSGDTVMIGAPADIYSGPPEATYVFERVGDDWLETQRLNPVGVLYGSSVAVDGDVAAVTAAFYGGAAVYVRAAHGSWEVVATLDAGHVAAVSGRDVLIGDTDPVSIHTPDDPFPRPGSLDVYRVEGNRVEFVTQLHSTDRTPRAAFGAAIAADDVVVLVGAPGASHPTAWPSGSVYVFDRETWRQIATLRSPSNERGAGAGVAVALHPRFAIVGAPFASDGTGAVYVFERHDGRWREAARIEPPEIGRVRSFGRALAVDGDRLLVGAPRTINDDGTGGELFVYDLRDGDWRFAGGLRPSQPGVIDDHGFGHHVVVSAGRVLVAAESTAHLFAPGGPAAPAGGPE